MIFVFMLSLFVSSAYADDDVEQPNVVYKRETVIDFEGVEIEGELVRPQGALLLDRKKASFNPLIKLRVDFDLEMSRSVDEIK